MSPPPAPSTKLTSDVKSLDDLAPIANIDALLTAKGSPFELTHEIVDGRISAVYAPQKTTIRDVILQSLKAHSSRTHLVYGAYRQTYGET